MGFSGGKFFGSALSLRSFCFAFGASCWALAFFLRGGRDSNLLSSPGLLFCLCHVGLAHFFVGIELSDNPVVLSRLFVLVAVGALVYFC